MTNIRIAAIMALLLGAGAYASAQSDTRSRQDQDLQQNQDSRNQDMRLQSETRPENDMKDAAGASQTPPSRVTEPPAPESKRPYSPAQPPLNPREQQAVQRSNAVWLGFVVAIVALAAFFIFRGITSDEDTTRHGPQQ